MPPWLHVVTGKGGVGKTSVACALALSHVRAGRRVLLAELDGGDRAARALDVPPSGYALREALPNLWLTDLNPQESLKEYVLLIVRMEAVYRMVFENRLVRSFLRLLPALGELTMLGKVWYEWQLPRAPDPRTSKFDAIVLDFPATGHARAILSAPRAVMASVPAGPMRENALRIDHMLRGPHASLILVTTPDETPMAEAEELHQFAVERQFGHVRMVANRCVPPLPPAALQAARVLAEAGGPYLPLYPSVALRDARARAGEKRLQRLAEQHRTLLRLPQMPAPLQRTALEEMAATLAAAWQP